MKLQEFISESLTQILNGVAETAAENTTDKAGINPKLANQPGRLMSHGEIVTEEGSLLQFVEFDISVTTQKDSNAKSGFGLFVGAVGIGTKGELSASDISLNKIKFKVPISFPYDNKS